MAGRKVAIITDTHFGVRKGSQIFHDYFENFYTETFFPLLDDLGISSVIHMGDVFDVRKSIDYWSLDWAKRVFFSPLQERGIKLHTIVGNHDIFYKNSLTLNAPGLNLMEYDNITVYDSPTTANVEGTEVFIVPWICEGNAELFAGELHSSNARVCMGHLELAGFYANKEYQCQHGTDPKVFNQFDRVFSGHFHKKSTRGNITYLGNPYQIYWNDEGETRGFHIYDLDTGELEFVPNPTPMFHKIYYDESKSKLFNPNKYKDSYIKIVVEGTSTPKKLASLVDKLYQVGVHDIKVIESLRADVDDEVELEGEDTLTTLTNYVNALDEQVDKSSVIQIFKSLYVEAQEI
jgi:DNA repair exonuclease SbcCD nuclease subunit